MTELWGAGEFRCVNASCAANPRAPWTNPFISEVRFRILTHFRWPHWRRISFSFEASHPASRYSSQPSHSRALLEFFDDDPGYLHHVSGHPTCVNMEPQFVNERRRAYQSVLLLGYARSRVSASNNSSSSLLAWPPILLQGTPPGRLIDALCQNSSTIIQAS